MTNATSYNIRTLAVRILQGYEITETKCAHCGVPMMEYQGNASCVVCPKLVDSIAEGEEDGGVEIINTLLSASMFGSMSSSVHSRQGVRSQSEELENNPRTSNADAIISSYPFENEDYYLLCEDHSLLSNESDETSVEEPSAAAHTESVAKTDQREEIMTTPPANEAKKDNFKNTLFMDKIVEMAKKQNEDQALNAHHVSFSLEPPASKSPAPARKSGPAALMHACESPKTAMKRMSINNIAGDDSAKRCYMPAWESKMNSVTKENLEGKIKTVASTDKELVNSVATTSHQPRDDEFFSELRQRAANKPKWDPFPRCAVDDTDGLKTRKSPATVAGPEKFASEEVVEKELLLQEQRYRKAMMRKMEEEKMEKSMTNDRRNTLTLSEVPADEMEALTLQRMKKDKVPKPFDENAEKQKPDDEAEKDVSANTEKLLKSTKEVLGESKLHLSNKKKQSQMPSSSDSLSDSMKEHSKRIAQLEAKTLRKYSIAALTTTNPNQSSASLKSVSTTETDKRQIEMLRSRVIELEAEALRKHSEAALAALHARQALDKMMQHRKKKNSDKSKGEKLNDDDDEKQSKIEDLSNASSLSTNESSESKDEAASHQSFSVESASLSQYSVRYEHRQSIDDGSREEVAASILTPPGEGRSRKAVRDINPPELNVRSRTHSSEYHREDRKHHPRSLSTPRSGMPPDIMLPSLNSPAANGSRERVHHASPRHSRDRPSRPHLLPYSPRTTPRNSSAFSHRPYSPSPDLYRNPNKYHGSMTPRSVHEQQRFDYNENQFASRNLESMTLASNQIAPDLYRNPNKYHGSMTPRTVHEQQRFDYNENQVASRNLESMTLASNQTVLERMMNQQQPRMVYSDNLVQPLSNNTYYNDQQQQMNRLHHDRMINQHQPRVKFSGNYIAPEQMVHPQRPRFGHFPAPHFDPAMQTSHLNSPKVQLAHPYGTQFDREANVQYVNPNVYMQDNRNDYPSMRYDGTAMRW